MLVTAASWVSVRVSGCAIASRRLALAVAPLVLLASGLGAEEAYASTCNQSEGTVTCAFSSTGAEQTFPVPAGVRSVGVEAVGAPGGEVTDPPFGTVQGGSGAVVMAQLTVTAHETLYVEVGGAGSDLGGQGGAGFNGGGKGSRLAGGGGGATDVRTAPRSAGLSPGRRLLVAGGGGGAGDASRDPHPDTEGGQGGSAGAAGHTANGADFDLTGGGGGKPGTASMAGSGGPGGVPGSACNSNLGPPGCNTGPNGAEGVLAAGGAGAADVTPPLGGGGGGGGGGLYGGGGGGGGAFGSLYGLAASGPGGGGGGGSSLVPAGGSVTPNTGNLPPEVTISYAAPAGLSAPTGRPRLNVAMAGRHAVAAGSTARYRITVRQTRPSSALKNVNVISRHAGRRVGHWHIRTLRSGRSRTLHLRVGIPRAARGLFCITTRATARYARGASARYCARVLIGKG